MTLSAFLTPFGLAALLVWLFIVLAAAQLTVRLIMAFAFGPTLLGAVLLTVASLPIAAIYDAVIGPHPSFAQRLTWIPVPMVLMALAGFATARWVLRFRRVRGQIVAAVMVGILAPHLFTLAPG